MNNYDFKKLRKKLKQDLNPKRFEHTLGVAYTAGALAMRYKGDVNQAILAGYLHDCAKCIDDQDQIKICSQNNIYISEAEYKAPFLLHAKLGAYYAQEKYDIEDKQILSAIKSHTTGKPDMSLLDKIIYIADYIEPGRNQVPNLAQIRELAFKDLDEVLFIILENILNYLDENKKYVDNMTLETYNYYKNSK